MTLRSRSCVIGRGVEMFSICSAMALASNMPTQIGSTRCPSLSRRITIGHVRDRIDHQALDAHFNLHSGHLGAGVRARSRRREVARERGSTVQAGGAVHPAPNAMWPRALDAYRQQLPDPRRLSRQIDDDVRAGPAGQLRVAAPARRVHEHIDALSDQLSRSAPVWMSRCSACSATIRRVFSSSGTSSGRRSPASVFGRGEYLNENML